MKSKFSPDRVYRRCGICIGHDHLTHDCRPSPKILKCDANFLVLKVPLAYNAIMKRPGLNAFRAIVSTYHLLMKFPTIQEVGKV